MKFCFNEKQLLHYLIEVNRILVAWNGIVGSFAVGNECELCSLVCNAWEFEYLGQIVHWTLCDNRK